MIRCVFIAVAVLFSPFVNAQDVATIKHNYVQSLLASDNREEKLMRLLTSYPKEPVTADQMVVELMQRYPLDSKNVEKYITHLQADGSWLDIDYASRQPSSWPPREHVLRMLEMTKACCTSGNPCFHSQKTTDAIHRAMNFWFTKQLVCPNWWYNRIGIPKTMGAVFILFENQLTPAEKENAVKLMTQASFGMTGQNKVWLAGNVLIRALLENNDALVRQARDTIASEIVVNRPEGIKADWSFHQHGPQQQFGNYGTAYIAEMSFWADLFKGTSMAFDRKQLDVLSSLVNEGYARILWKGYMDVNCLGRQFFKRSQLDKAFSVSFSINDLAESDPVNRSIYESILTDNYANDSATTVQQGVYHFWQSDMTVFRTPAWMASVKMSSPRVIGAESGNGDNLKGYYLADGATFTCVDGDEYADIFPCWDWHKIPGITCYDTDKPLRQLPWSGYRNGDAFVGNVNNWQTGITAMHFERDGIDARKCWIFTGNYLLCMGAGISADSGCVVTTSIEQRLRKNDNLLHLRNGQWEPIHSSPLKNEADQRYFHHNTGYIILTPADGMAVDEMRTGDWNSVMAIYHPEDTVTKDIVALWLNHGKDPKEASYQYLIAPNMSKEQVQTFDLKMIQVKSNSKDLQAVCLPEIKTCFLAVYNNADIALSNTVRFTASIPALFMLTEQDNRLIVSCSDPTQTLDKLTFQINGKPYSVPLPTGEKRGTSATLTLNLE